MKKVAKLIIQNDDSYLLMYRSNHPTFGNDPDLPGGTAEEYDQSELVTMLREVQEEIGWAVDEKQVSKVYSGDDYSRNGTHYSLFITKVSNRPEVRMSWEHSSYEWIKKEDFIEKAKNANDTYMHMTGAVLESLKPAQNS